MIFKENTGFLSVLTLLRDLSVFKYVIAGNPMK
jgi:hypothetical protein